MWNDAGRHNDNIHNIPSVLLQPHLGAEAVEEREALLLARELEQVGALAHDRRAAGLSFEQHKKEEGAEM